MEMKVGFIEMENQLASVKDQVSNVVTTMHKFSGNVEKGFLAIEGAMDEDFSEIKDEISTIKKRLDDANL